MAAALAVTGLIDDEQLNEKAQQQGEWLKAALQNMAEEFDCIGDIRGTGAMVAMELVEARDRTKPDQALTQALVQEAGRQGLILLSCGVRANVIRFLIPLTASKEIVTEGLSLLSLSLRIVQNMRPAK